MAFNWIWVVFGRASKCFLVDVCATLKDDLEYSLKAICIITKWERNSLTILSIDLV